VDVHRSEEGVDLREWHEIRCTEVFKGKFKVVWGEMLGGLDELLQERFELVHLQKPEVLLSTK
jgi:hypothetical protein